MTPMRYDILFPWSRQISNLRVKIERDNGELLLTLNTADAKYNTSNLKLAKDGRVSPNHIAMQMINLSR